MGVFVGAYLLIADPELLNLPLFPVAQFGNAFRIQVVFSI
jgi:hypothetical protein